MTSVGRMRSSSKDEAVNRQQGRVERCRLVTVAKWWDVALQVRMQREAKARADDELTKSTSG